MSDKSKWKRKLPTRIYDYNFKVSEGYYAPQTEFIETRPLHRTHVAPPEHASYAERYAQRPWFGGVQGLPYPETEAAMYKPLLKPRAASLSRLSTPTRTFEDDDEPVSSRLSRGRSRLGSVSRLDDDDDFYTPNNVQDIDVKEELRRINEKLNSAKLKPGLPVGPRSYVDTPRITQSEWRRRNPYLPLNDTSSVNNVLARPPLPPSSSIIRKSSINYETQVESKPPLSFRTRRPSVSSVTFDDDDDEDIDISSSYVRKPRSRNISFSDSNDMPPRPPSTNRLIEENQRRGFNAQQMADARRLQASEELSGYINRKLERLDNLSSTLPEKVDVPHHTAYSRRIRASSMDPYQSSRYNSESTESRPRPYVWGYCK